MKPKPRRVFVYLPFFFSLSNSKQSYIKTKYLSGVTSVTV